MLTANCVLITFLLYVPRQVDGSLPHPPPHRTLHPPPHRTLHPPPPTPPHPPPPTHRPRCHRHHWCKWLALYCWKLFIMSTIYHLTNDYLLQWAICCSSGFPLSVFFSGLTPDKRSTTCDWSWPNKSVPIKMSSQVVCSRCWEIVVAEVGYIVVPCGPQYIFCATIQILSPHQQNTLSNV